MLNPADTGDPAEQANRTRILNARINALVAQANLNAAYLGEPARAGHTCIVTRDGVTVASASAPSAFAGRVLRRYISGVLHETETFGPGESERARYLERRQILAVNQELNPTNTFTDLAS